MAQSPPAEARFRSLYDGHLDQLRRYFFRRIPACDVDDAVAEVFIVAWRRIGEVPADGAAVLWLYGIARNVVRNHDRTNRRQMRLSHRLLGVMPSSTTGRGPEHEVMWRAEGDRVRAGLAMLRSNDQEILRLAAWEGLKPAEIADVFGIRPHAASIRLSRARDRLARALLSGGINSTDARPRHVSTGEVHRDAR